MNTFQFWSQSDRLIVLIVPAAEKDNTEVILSNFQFWSKSDLLVALMVPEAEMNTAEVILSTINYKEY